VDTRIALMEGLWSADYAGRIAIAAYGRDAVNRLKAAGADLVLEPHRDAASQAASQLTESPTDYGYPNVRESSSEYAV
ncbi:MAG: hypothetical protein AAGH38_06690, partial [Pseudomonadota bacterium]